MSHLFSVGHGGLRGGLHGRFRTDSMIGMTGSATPVMSGTDSPTGCRGVVELVPCSLYLAIVAIHRSFHFLGTLLLLELLAGVTFALAAVRKYLTTCIV